MNVVGWVATAVVAGVVIGVIVVVLVVAILIGRRRVLGPRPRTHDRH